MRVDELFHEGHLINQVVHNGDGTGTRTTYDESGQIVSTETIYGLEVPLIPTRVLPADPDLTPPKDLRNP